MVGTKMSCWCLSIFQTVLAVVILLFVLLKIYCKLGCSRCTSKVSLVGKTAIVTGANTGIGFETALDFACRGARVIIACRDECKANRAKDEIVAKTRNDNVVVKLVDFSSLKSVRRFAEDVLNGEERLDILVNNAGVSSSRDKLTDDGLNLVMQVNYFGPVLLTILLVELLKKSSPSRIVNVSSLLAKYPKLDANNLNAFAGAYYSYNNTKLCNVLFAMKLAKLLEKSNVTVYSLHPGAINTEIFRKFSGFRKMILDFFKEIYFKTPEEGAQTTIHASVAQGIEKYTGRHFVECQPVATYQSAKDSNLEDAVWQKTVEILNLAEKVENL